MKVERTKNATRNIIFGFILKIYQLALPFLMRTVMIYCLGVQYLGLNSLFTSVLQVLNLAELGVGNAMVFSMYKPIAEDDTSTICSLMKLYRLYYRIIGLVICILGLLLLPVIPQLIKGNVPSDINIYILYLLNLATTVLTYWLFAYKNCLVTAHQRTDVTSKVTILTNSFQYILQFVTLFFLHNYYIYLIIALVTQVITNISTAAVVNKMYPNYHPKGTLNKQLTKQNNQRIRDLFTSKIGSVIVNSADTIVISAFLGLTMLAIYQNYFYILNSIIGIVSIIFQSCTAGIGNSLIVETKQKNFNDLKKFTFLIAWLSGFSTCCLLCLYQPFMKIWVGEDLMLGFTAVICFCIYYYVYEINLLLNMYKDAAGIWHKDRFRTLITALTNLALNLLTVNYWGIYGVIFSTVLSVLLVGMPWLLNNLFTCLFDKCNLKNYLFKLFRYTLSIIVISILCFVFCNLISLEGWPLLIVRCIICIIIFNGVFIIIYRNTNEFGELLNLVNRTSSGKLKFITDKLMKKNK